VVCGSWLQVKAAYKYQAEDVDELNFEVGEIIQVVEYDDPDEQVLDTLCTNQRPTPALSTNERLPMIFSTNKRTPPARSTNKKLPIVFSTNQRPNAGSSTNKRLPIAFSTNQRPNAGSFYQ
jgi:hypothetical protein